MDSNTVTGMEAVVSSISSSLSAANLWGVVGTVVPILAITVLFGLGFFLIRKILKKAQHGKGGI